MDLARWIIRAALLSYRWKVNVVLGQEVTQACTEALAQAFVDCLL